MEGCWPAGNGTAGDPQTPTAEIDVSSALQSTYSFQ